MMLDTALLQLLTVSEKWNLACLIAYNLRVACKTDVIFFLHFSGKWRQVRDDDTVKVMHDRRGTKKKTPTACRLRSALTLPLPLLS